MEHHYSMIWQLESGMQPFVEAEGTLLDRYKFTISQSSHYPKSTDTFRASSRELQLTPKQERCERFYLPSTSIPRLCRHITEEPPCHFRKSAPLHFQRDIATNCLHIVYILKCSELWSVVIVTLRWPQMSPWSSSWASERGAPGQGRSNCALGTRMQPDEAGWSR